MMYKYFDLTETQRAWLQNTVVPAVERIVESAKSISLRRKADDTFSLLIPLVPFSDPQTLFNNSGGKHKISRFDFTEFETFWHVVYEIKGDILNILLLKNKSDLYDQIYQFSETLSERLGKRVGGKTGSFISVLFPGYCLPPHRDPTQERIHIPLVTNDKALFSTFKGEDKDHLETVSALHMEVGGVYSLATSDWHSVINGSSTQMRAHLVMDCRSNIDTVL